MLWCHWSVAIYESSTRANISHLGTNSFLWGLYGNRPVDCASGVLAVFVIKVHIQAPQWVVDYLLGKILKGRPVWVYWILYLVRLFRNNIFRIAWFSRLLGTVRCFPFFHSFNLADWLTLGYVFAVKPISKKRLPEITFVQFKKQSIPTAQLTPQIHRMKVMLKPDSHEFRVPLMPMK